MPGQLVYGCDMLLPIKFNADWALIERQKQLSINNSNRKENKKRIQHEYKNGDKVLLQKPGILRRFPHHILVPMKSKAFLRMAQ